MSRFWFFFVVILLILGRYFSVKPRFVDGQKVKITAKIMSEPVRYASRQKVDLYGLKIYLPLYPEVGYGDRVVVTGTVKDGGLTDVKLNAVGVNNHWLYRLREKIIAFYRRSLPEPHASLVAGIVLGSKSQIPRGFWESLRKTGTAHVVVASGMNVTFVAGYLIGFLTLFAGRRKVLSLVLIGIWGYAVLAGFEAPIVRAAIMTTAVLIAQKTGRLTASWPVLLTTVILMLLVKPLWLTDLGFILSFVATASLMLFQKRVENFFRFLPAKLNLFKEGLITSLAAQVGVAPIIWATFGQFNLFSPLINALILWTVPGIMILGSLAGIIGLFFPFLGQLILYLSYPLTWWFVTAVSIF